MATRIEGEQNPYFRTAPGCRPQLLHISEARPFHRPNKWAFEIRALFRKQVNSRSNQHLCFVIESREPFSNPTRINRPFHYAVFRIFVKNGIFSFTDFSFFHFAAFLSRAREKATPSHSHF